jgi:hypothetical protein
LIAGTATAVSGKVARRQAGGAAPPPASAAPGGLTDQALGQLKQLAELHASGVLTDEEFATQKARILN